MYTLNGIGTQLYGRRYLSKKDLKNMGLKVKGLKPYIATKWFVFLFIPLIPLSSHIVFLDYNSDEKNLLTYGSKYYHMIRINLNWNQVLKMWLVPIAIFFFLWLILR